MLTKGPHGLGKVVPSASRDRERSRKRARSTQAPADAAPDVTSEVGFWTANYAERLRSIAVKYVGIRTSYNDLERQQSALICCIRQVSAATP